MNIDCHGEIVGVNRFLKDMANITTVGHVDSGSTDTDRVTGGDDTGASSGTKCDVVIAAGIIGERIATKSRISAARIVSESRSAGRRIVITAAEKQRVKAGSGVGVAANVLGKRVNAGSGVGGASSVV